MPSVPLGHLRISPGDMDDAVWMVQRSIETREMACCIPINLTKYVVSKRDKKLADAINQAELVIADGVPIKWLGKRAGIKNVHRVTGVDLSERLLSMATSHGWSLYFFGASPENLDRALERIASRYNSPKIAGSRDGYFDEPEVPGIIEQINQSGADILLIGLGMPQKEYFLQEHRHELKIPFCITVGGAIDIWADAKKRTPKWIQTLGLEWLVRSMYDLSKARNILRYGWSFAKELVLYRAPRGEAVSQR